MNVTQIIQTTAFLLLAVLILVDYIVIKKPYKYLIILFIVPAIIVQTPVVKNLNRNLELIFGTIYFMLTIIFLIYYGVREASRKK
ncbi:hypothetical protein [Clostridium kluyveri]|uniref:hypothetical protein n=1 Tax=Clostridium kluyveri TaxID=1534 RepID=UPI002246F360|nr:hypothetical protein [Clostridium kluyveri]UZQ49988.1 hypothetical protein OP486_18875 [Clostridium kluyveri]